MLGEKGAIASSPNLIAGFITAFSLWWIYFDNVSGSALETARTSGRLQILQLWLYIHLPLLIGLAATGVGVEHVVKQAGNGVPLPDPERWLICGSIASRHGALAILHRMGVIFLCKARTRYRLGGMATMLVLAIAGNALSPLSIILLVALVGLVQVGLDLYQGKPEPAVDTV